jgi:hypothetical protein
MTFAMIEKAYPKTLKTNQKEEILNKNLIY